MTIQDTLEEIREDFASMEDWRERFQYIIDLGKEMDPLPEALHTDDYLVEGCVSRVWFEGRLEGDRVVFRGDSDAVIVKGLVGLLVSIYSGHRPGEILAVPPDFLVDLGISTHLTPNRSNGLAALARRIQVLAASFQDILDRQADSNPG